MEQTLKGTIIYEDDFEPINGYITIENGIIKDIEPHNFTSDIIIAPCFINSHTHIGDSVIKDPPNLPLSELVQPPDGLKHRILRQTSYDDLILSMKATLNDMVKTGTCYFCDFRENGINGSTALKDALSYVPQIKAKIFGRPDGNMNYLDICDGTGISSTNDMKIELIKDIVRETREKGKKFGIHAGERDEHDIIPALELLPDFIVHLTNAKEKHLKLVSDKNIPAIVCLRSNYFTNSGIPPIKKMLENEILIGVGTDNVMMNSVNMFSEMEFLAKTYRLDDRQVFKFCTLNGAKILGLNSELGSIKTGKKARLMIVTTKSDNMQGAKNPLSSLVRRARPDDIIGII